MKIVERLKSKIWFKEKLLYSVTASVVNFVSNSREKASKLSQNQEKVESSIITDDVSLQALWNNIGRYVDINNQTED